MAIKRKDVLTTLAAYHREKQIAPLREAQKSLAAVLDGLNAFGALDDLRRARFSPVLASPPAARSGLMPEPWVGVMFWHRPSGYLGYKTLTIIGVWGVAKADQAMVIVGSKRLEYAEAFYDAEAYVKIIRTAFDLYYHDNGSPPANAVLCLIPDPARRLEQREEIAAALSGLA